MSAPSRGGPLGPASLVLLVALYPGCTPRSEQGAGAAAGADSGTPLGVALLRCEYEIDPLGIEAREPRLFWQLRAERRDVRQSAYQLQAIASGGSFDLAGSELLWDSGRVESAESTHVPWGGPTLASRQRVEWRVRVWDEQGRASPWSAPARFEMGLLSAADWRAEWIRPALDPDPEEPRRLPLLRRGFELGGPVVDARLYATALGLYEARLNGRRVGDAYFTPGWTAYRSRLQYQSYDVTGYLREGENVLGVLLGDGWYRGGVGFGEVRATYGDQLGLLLQLEVTTADGRTKWITSDPGWRAASGPILLSDLYLGERHDARLVPAGWDEPGFDDLEWRPVETFEHPRSILVAQSAPPVRLKEELEQVALLRTPAGETVVDFGQNLVGWVRLRVRGARGTTVRLRHAEVLDSAGNFYTANLRGARQEVEYTLAGGGAPEVFEPRFSFQGFRYVAVEGYPGELGAGDLTAIVLHSDLERTGELATSDPRLDRLQHNIVWGQKGNFLDLPTDCPQRDERLGWTGDIQAFAPTAAFNMDVARFLGKWLADLAADQLPDGRVPHVIPNPLEPSLSGSSGWGDAAVIVPWTLWERYGDRRLLERQYPSMVAWVGYVERQAGERFLWLDGFHFGDWLAPRGDDRLFPEGVTPKELIATAFFAHSTELVRRSAEILGRRQDARRFAELRSAIGRAFLEEFVTPNGRVASGTQTAYVLALHFDLLPEELRAQAAARLVEEIRRRGNHLSTGFLGTPLLCPVLGRFGYTDVAYDLLLQESYPSWLYPLSLGATTMWERWDGIRPDGELQSAEMNSFNHYAYGAIGDFMYQTIGGLRPDPERPGYRHAVVRPEPGGGLRHARASLETLYGRLASSWELDRERFRLQLEVPPNTTASVWLPHAAGLEVAESGQPLAGAAGILRQRREGGSLVLEVGSGLYDLSYPAAGFGPIERPRFTLHTPLAQLLESQAAREVLLAHLPDLEESIHFRLRSQQTLYQIARLRPDLLTDEHLSRVGEELAALAP